VRHHEVTRDLLQPRFRMTWDRALVSGAAAESKAAPQEVSMTPLPKPARRRLAPILTLGFVAVLAAACASATTKPAAGSALVAASALPSTGAVPVSLNLATPTPAASPQALVPVGGAALAVQQQQVSVIAAVEPSVVQIQTAAGLGSGVVYDSKGDIVTNAHVVGSYTSFSVTLTSGKSYRGTLVGTYLPDDIAVIRISATGLTPATFGDSSALAVGDFVLAIGNPLGLGTSVTEGIVSALDRQVSEPNGYALPDVIQTSAAINPGNSGGALVDLAGQVVGIPTLAATDPQIGGSAPGIGFAISSNRAKLIADQLIASGKVTASGRAYMGIELQDAAAGGAIVYSVSAGGPAAKAGLVAGDVITAVDGVTVPDSTTLVDLVAAHRPGDTIQLSITHRNGRTATVSLTLGQAPA
jgi:putative serine protease PepD